MKKRSILKLLLAAPLLWGTASAQAGEPMRYVYPAPESGADVRLGYYWELLQAALEETTANWGPYEVSAWTKPLNSARAEMMIKASLEITVMARTTSAEREKTLLPILIPLDKGLTGYRLFLTKSHLQARLKSVRNANDLKEFSIGQGANWIDVDILRSAGMNVVTGPTYENLFNMLEVNRFELFSRGVNEIGKEYENAKPRVPDLIIDKSLILYYPLPRYFFFSRTPEGERLAGRVEEGLRRLMKNGKFDKRYQAFKRSILADLSLAGRRLIRIENPTLSAATPLGDASLWDNLESELKPPP